MHPTLRNAILFQITATTSKAFRHYWLTKFKALDFLPDFVSAQLANPLFFYPPPPTRFPPLAGPLKRGTFWAFFLCVYKKWPSWGGDKNQFSVCVWPTFLWPSEKKGWGTLLYYFEVFSVNVENASKLPFLYECVFWNLHGRFLVVYVQHSVGFFNSVSKHFFTQFLHRFSKSTRFQVSRF